MSPILCSSMAIEKDVRVISETSIFTPSLGSVMLPVVGGGDAWPCPWPCPCSADVHSCTTDDLFTKQNLPCTILALIRLRLNPTQPTISINRGFLTNSILMNLSIDCKKMESASARRNTPLKNAPTSSARCNAYVKPEGLYSFSCTCEARKAMKYAIMSCIIAIKHSRAEDTFSAYIQVVKGVRNQCLF